MKPTEAMQVIKYYNGKCTGTVNFTLKEWEDLTYFPQFTYAHCREECDTIIISQFLVEGDFHTDEIEAMKEWLQPLEITIERWTVYSMDGIELVIGDTHETI